MQSRHAHLNRHNAPNSNGVSAEVYPGQGRVQRSQGAINSFQGINAAGTTHYTCGWHTHAHTYINTHKHTHTHTNTNSHTHRHANTHTQHQQQQQTLPSCTGRHLQRKGRRAGRAPKKNALLRRATGPLSSGARGAQPPPHTTCSAPLRASATTTSAGRIRRAATGRRPEARSPRDSPRISRSTTLDCAGLKRLDMVLWRDTLQSASSNPCTV